MSARWEAQVRAAVKQFWLTRDHQSSKQRQSRRQDHGARTAVTGGAQMNGFADLLASTAIEAGVPEESIFLSKALELPGYFRPTKLWDLLIVHEQRLLAALELKSQVGPSFGNNFNNRTEEAMGSALDLWTAFREGAFQTSPAPWMGYLFLLEDCPASRRAVTVREPHFDVFPEFHGASYARRYELFCKKLLRERHYTSAALILSDRSAGTTGDWSEPSEDLTVRGLLKSLETHLRTGMALQ